MELLSADSINAFLCIRPDAGGGSVGRTGIRTRGIGGGRLPDRRIPVGINMFGAGAERSKKERCGEEAFHKKEWGGELRGRTKRTPFRPREGPEEEEGGGLLRRADHGGGLRGIIGTGRGHIGGPAGLAVGFFINRAGLGGMDHRGAGTESQSGGTGQEES